MSKAGFTGMRNINLSKIDILLKDMQEETDSIILTCKHEQTLALQAWMNISFILTFLVSPVLIAIRCDFPHIEYDLRVILAPVSFSWVLLPFLVIYLQNRVSYHYKEL